jgi:glycerol-1-phosphate dehydrogenase [NAD(P)+]
MTHCWNLPLIYFATLDTIKEDRSTALICSKGTWQAVNDRLTLPVSSMHEVAEATIDYWDGLCEAVTGDVVYAVGGGLAVDAAKYVAVKKQLPLVSIPTAISVDAFLTWASGYREDGCVKYIETKPPDEVYVDYDVIANGPPTIQVAGITDVMSIATGRWDWKYAHDKGQNPKGMEYDPNVDAMAKTILDAVMAAADSMGKLEPAGIKRLVECLAMEVQLCNFIGHSRPEEGSEHYFAYAAEEVLGKGLPHGDLVGPGIVIMAALQGQDTGPLVDAMRKCRVPLNNIPEDTSREILSGLPDYCRRHEFPSGIAHEITTAQIQ